MKAFAQLVHQNYKENFKLNKAEEKERPQSRQMSMLKEWLERESESEHSHDHDHEHHHHNHHSKKKSKSRTAKGIQSKTVSPNKKI